MNTTVDPLILIDTREQQPLAFPGWRTASLGLWAGDYSLRGYAGDDVPNGLPTFGITIERKSIADLYGTLMQGRKRFEKELKRMHYYAWRGLVIEGTPADLWQYVEGTGKQGDPNAIMASLRSFEINDNLHVAWAVDREGAALTIMEWLRLFAQRQFHEARRIQRMVTVPPPVACMPDDEAQDIAQAAQAAAQSST